MATPPFKVNFPPLTVAFPCFRSTSVFYGPPFFRGKPRPHLINLPPRFACPTFLLVIPGPSSRPWRQLAQQGAVCLLLFPERPGFFFARPWFPQTFPLSRRSTLFLRTFTTHIVVPGAVRSRNLDKFFFLCKAIHPFWYHFSPFAQSYDVFTE